MSELASVALTILAALAVFLLGRSVGLRKDASAEAARGNGGRAPAGSAQGAASGELVAVIAAAVSAASGMEMGSFRLVGIQRSSGGSGSGQSGLNTPVWGHIERFSRGE